MGHQHAAKCCPECTAHRSRTIGPQQSGVRGTWATGGKTLQATLAEARTNWKPCSNRPEAESHTIPDNFLGSKKTKQKIQNPPGTMSGESGMAVAGWSDRNVQRFQVRQNTSSSMKTLSNWPTGNIALCCFYVRHMQCAAHIKWCSQRSCSLMTLADSSLFVRQQPRVLFLQVKINRCTASLDFSNLDRIGRV